MKKALRFLILMAIIVFTPTIRAEASSNCLELERVVLTLPIETLTVSADGIQTCFEGHSSIGYGAVARHWRR